MAFLLTNLYVEIEQVLLESRKDKDASGHALPNLVYISREKNKQIPHNFKAGALNVLVSTFKMCFI